MRGTLHCCFTNHSCTADWVTISRGLAAPAIAFLTNTKKVLDNKTAEGYKACHKIEGYDASKCAEDCKKEENSAFAKNCTANGGFFKCCIRRDKVFCHQCRFCCSLPICSYKDNKEILHKGKSSVDEKETKFELSAIDKFVFLGSMYKAPDYRCLKPITDKDPDTWPHYVHKDFQNAMTIQELEKAGTIEFDINFYNFEDPTVFSRFTGPNYKKYWKKTFGYDWALQINPNIEYMVGNKSSYMASYKAPMKECLTTELGSFGKECKKGKGLYKCCASMFSIRPFEQIRKDLKALGMIKDPVNPVCGEEMKDDSKCVIFLITHMCTKQDSLTTKRETKFMTPTQPKYEIGAEQRGDPELGGMRSQGCDFLNTCQKPVIMPKITGDLYDQAHDKKSYCLSAAVAEDIVYSIPKTKGFEKYVNSSCNKKTVDSVFICDKKHTEHPEAKKLTKEIRNVLKILKNPSEKNIKRKKEKSKSKKKRKKRRKNRKQKKKPVKKKKKVSGKGRHKKKGKKRKE